MSSDRTPCDFKLVDELFKKIKNPKQLWNWMNQNLRYGLLTKDKKSIPVDDYDRDWPKDKLCTLQSPDEVISNRIAKCWDETE